MSKTLNRGLLIAVLALTCIASIVALAGCTTSKSEEDLVKDAVAKEFSNLKSTSVSNYLTNYPEIKTTLDAYQINPDTYIQPLLQTMTYSVDKVTINGNSAVTNVSVKMIDFDKIVEALKAKAVEISGNLDLSVLANTDVASVVGSILLDAVKDPGSVFKTYTVNLDFQKVNGTWTPTQPGQLGTRLATLVVSGS